MTNFTAKLVFLSMDVIPAFCLADGHGQEAEQQGVETKGFYSPDVTGWQI